MAVSSSTIINSLFKVLDVVFSMEMEVQELVGVKEEASNNSGNNANIPKSQVCGKFGHVALYCWHGFDQNFHPSANNQCAAMVASTSQSGDEGWFMDTGATHHVTPDLTNMTSTNPIAGSDKLFVGNGTGLSNSNIGNSVISCSLRPLHLKNVLHVTWITTNLISVQKLCSDNNVTVEFNVGGFIVKYEFLAVPSKFC